MFKFVEENEWVKIYETKGYFLMIEKEENSYRPMYLKTNGEYFPEIYIDFKMKNFDGITIQTTSYGSKVTEEIESIIDGYKTAVEVAKYLEEVLKDGNILNAIK